MHTILLVFFKVSQFVCSRKCKINVNLDLQKSSEFKMSEHSDVKSYVRKLKKIDFKWVALVQLDFIRPDSLFLNGKCSELKNPERNANLK